jgi:hypothetical protein
LTIVAACINAETLVGPVMAVRSHSVKGNWADLVSGPMRKRKSGSRPRADAADPSLNRPDSWTVPRAMNI